jgi:hypothetical protein
MVASQYTDCRETRICGDVAVSVFRGLEKNLPCLFHDLEQLLAATDKVIGRPLRRELFSQVNLEEKLSLKKRMPVTESPVVIEGKPFYLQLEDEDANCSYAEIVIGSEMTLRLGAGARKIDFADYWHEIGHGVYQRMSSEFMVAFSRCYSGLFHNFIGRVRAGGDPVRVAKYLCSDRAFLDGDDEPRFTCWRGFVGQEYPVDDRDKQQYFHRRRVPKVADAHSLNLHPEEAFAEMFAHYYKLRRRPAPYSIVPDPGFESKHALYRFAKRYMKAIIASVRPAARRQRVLFSP